MSNLSYKIRLYLNRKVDFSNDVILHDEGDGQYIKEWNVDEAQLTVEQLNALNSQAITLENNTKIRKTRKISYGNIREQLDLLYKDMLADKGDKTGEWFKAVKKVKDDNPKE